MHCKIMMRLLNKKLTRETILPSYSSIIQWFI